MSNIGLYAAVAAVIVDSIVTVFVGWRLNKTARQETARAVEKVKPALKAEMEKAAVILIPLVVEQLKTLLVDKGKDNENTRTVHSIECADPTPNGRLEQSSAAPYWG